MNVKQFAIQRVSLDAPVTALAGASNREVRGAVTVAVTDAARGQASEIAIAMDDAVSRELGTSWR